MKAEIARQIPTIDEIQLVRVLIPLTDNQLANRLDVDERGGAVRAC